MKSRLFSTIKPASFFNSFFSYGVPELNFIHRHL